MDQYKESIEEVDQEEIRGHPSPRGVSSREKVPEIKEKVLILPEKPVEKVEQEVKQEIVEEKKPALPAGDLPLEPLANEEDKVKRGKKVEEISKLGVQEQIGALRNLAFEEGPDFAVGVAKDLDNAFVLDEFHDTLDKLGLIKEGKLKEI